MQRISPPPNQRKIRLLVVSDFDLRSASRLAESPLLSSAKTSSVWKRKVGNNGTGQRPIDLCIAINSSCGGCSSCCCSCSNNRNNEYDPHRQYYTGSQKRNRILNGYRKSTANSTNNDITVNVFCHGVAVDQLRGRAHARRIPGVTDTNNLFVANSNFRSIPVPVPLPQVHQPRFHSSNYQQQDDSTEKESSGVEDDNSAKSTTKIDDEASIVSSLMPCACTCAETPEEYAAKLGLLTASLAQLESIVCRVLYLLDDHHHDDDNNNKSYNHNEGRPRRLTSNSLDIQNRWLPLLDGLGIGGIGNSGTPSHDDGDDDDKILEALLRRAFPRDPHDKNDDDPPLFQSVVISVTSSGRSSTKSNALDGTSSSFVRDHCLLKIETGSNAEAAAATKTKWGGVVLHPGSLQKHGDYCLVDLAVSMDDETIDGSTWHWKVEQTQFCRLEDGYDEL